MDIKKIFQLAAENKASDLHLAIGLPPIVRVDGRLFPIYELPGADVLGVKPSSPQSFSMDENGALGKIGAGVAGGYPGLTNIDMEAVLSTLLTAEEKKTFAKDKDLDIGYSLNGFRYRINFCYERNNIRVATRVISDQKPSLEEIGMPKVIYNLLKLKQGLILLTGPTGCGKSTSLAAMINYLNDNENYNILTLEDPIEFMFESNRSVISQRQLGLDMTSFGEGLRHVLRQDPNVIMVGEMRDLETISTTITLAETGHLVIATLHTHNASQTIDRIIDTFPPHQQGQVKSQLSMILSAVISQKLVPKVGGGRTAIREIMIRNSAIANLIREQKVAQIRNVIETSYKDGMITFERSLKETFEQGLISKENAEELLKDPMLF